MDKQKQQTNDNGRVERKKATTEKWVTENKPQTMRQMT